MKELLSEEDLSMTQSVRKLAEAEIPKYQTNEHYGTVPRELFAAFSSLGLSSLTISEEYGGLDASATTVMAVLEEIARVDAGPAVFLAVHLMVSGLIDKHGSEELKRKYLPRFATGELLGAFALTEPGAGSDAASLTTKAEANKDGYSISGEKCYITSAGFADCYLTFAKTDPDKGKDGISAFLIEKNALGLSIGKPEKKMGCELSPIASLTFSKTQVSSDSILGAKNEGFRVALSGLAGGRINIAACANGLADSAIEHAISHLKERKQFGSALIDFQGLQFMLADMKIKLEAAQLLTWRAAKVLDGGEDTKLSSSVAKCFATDSAMSIATDAVQLLGGAGYIEEYKVEKLMRDAKMMQIVEGANQIQRVIIARQMVK